jgi:hypothetical protein
MRWHAMKAGLPATGAVKVYANKTVIVVYGALGSTDNSSAVDAAVKGL